MICPSSLAGMRLSHVFPVLSLVAAAALTGCANNSESSLPPDADITAKQTCLSVKEISGRAPKLVSTVAPITNLIAMVVGDVGPTIDGLVPEGTNSHTFEPPPSAAAVVEDADVVFVNGLGLEDPSIELAKNNSKSAVICELGTAVLPEGGWVYDFSFPKEGGKPNPHLWTNPPMVQQYVDLIRDVVIALDPSNTKGYNANHAKISRVITDLDEAMTIAAQTIPAQSRKLLTYHDAYAYFALRYDFEVVGAIEPSSFEEPSPREIVNLIEQVKALGVKAVFGSEVFPSPVLAQIGKETGVRYIDVLRDDDLLGEPGDAQHSWADLMKFNFVTMVEALGGDATALLAVKTDAGVVDKAFYPQ
jgi:ABC-type Zn uptake system ZnuABC Zn-binding protein ZnuA